MKKIFCIMLILAVVIVLGVLYYNENIKTNTITDGTFIWKGNGLCGKDSLC